MANEKESRGEGQNNSERVEIEPSENKNLGKTEDKSGDPGRTPGKAEGEDDASAAMPETNR
jgi:hypothetical protein